MKTDEDLMNLLVSTIGTAMSEGETALEIASNVFGMLRASGRLAPEAAWQMMENCPSDGERIWVRGGRYAKPEIREADGAWWRYSRGCGSIMVPTEWAPLVVPGAAIRTGAAS